MLSMSGSDQNCGCTAVSEHSQGALQLGASVAYPHNCKKGVCRSSAVSEARHCLLRAVSRASRRSLALRKANLFPAPSLQLYGLASHVVAGCSVIQNHVQHYGMCGIAAQKEIKKRKIGPLTRLGWLAPVHQLDYVTRTVHVIHMYTVLVNVAIPVAVIAGYLGHFLKTKVVSRSGFNHKRHRGASTC